MAVQRAAWKGHLKLALVSCPVRLFSATRQVEKLSAHYLHKDTRNRIRMIPHDPALGKVARTDLVSAYQHADTYVVLNEADLAEIRAPSDKTLLIESFVDGQDVDPIYFDQPFYLVPDGSVAIEAFDVLKTAMSTRGKMALGRIVMNRRERMVAIRVRGTGFVLTTLRGADEIRDPDDFFAELPSCEPTTEVKNLAEQLIAMRSGRFDPHVFKDRYQAALHDLIEQKLTYGETIDQGALETPINAANDDEKIQPSTTVADAFRRSVDGQRKPPAKSHSKPSRKKPVPAKRAHVVEKSPG